MIDHEQMEVEMNHADGDWRPSYWLDDLGMFLVCVAMVEAVVVILLGWGLR